MIRGRIARFALALFLLAGPLLGRLFLSGGGRRAQAVASAPIALVVDPGAPNPFGLYLGEILRAEGWAAHDVISLSSISPSLLQPYPVVLLAEVPLNGTQAGILRDYVENRWSAGNPHHGPDERRAQRGASGAARGFVAAQPHPGSLHSPMHEHAMGSLGSGPPFPA